MIKDTSYALIRRLFFVESALRQQLLEKGYSEISIADIGCGTGELLTIPLASEMGLDVKIYAYEPEDISYSHLCNQIRTLNLNNVVPVQDKHVLENRLYDAILISEVIEHVENPTEFLSYFRSLLHEHGIMIITTPNGYGIFEIETMLFYSLEIVGIIPLLRTLKKKVYQYRGISIKKTSADTLAISPHINFFSLPELYSILHKSGFSLLNIEGRNFAAGPFSDRIIDKSVYLIEWNSRLGKILPLRLATDWMIVAKKSLTVEDGKTQLQAVKLNLIQRLYTSYKRWLNLYLSKRN